MIVVLCGAEGAKVQQEWASRTDVTELHAVGFYPTAKGRGIVVHQRPEAAVAQDLRPDVVVGGDVILWPEVMLEKLAKAAGHESVDAAFPPVVEKKRRGRPPNPKA